MILSGIGTKIIDIGSPSSDISVEECSVWVGGDGNVCVDSAAGQIKKTFYGAKAGTVIPCRIVKVYGGTNTTATNMLGVA